ncbi:hypothetical protein [Elioraea sp.]|uniref:hypothetical protein n=1 Tax=Elioraea sp. TaxID=2185103 RepID=UPI0025BCD524|nr:hypothetical protein [Elioraea sp.]
MGRAQSGLRPEDLIGDGLNVTPPFFREARGREVARRLALHLRWRFGQLDVADLLAATIQLSG